MSASFVIVANSSMKLKRLDQLGGVLSMGCALHCLLLPILTIAWPVLGTTFLSNELFHQMLLYLVIPTAVISFGIGCRRHPNPKVIISAVLGIGVLASITLLGEEQCATCVHPSEQNGNADVGIFSSAWLSKWGMVLGSILLCYAHWCNFRSCETSSCEH